MVAAHRGLIEETMELVREVSLLSTTNYSINTPSVPKYLGLGKKSDFDLQQKLAHAKFIPYI